VVRRDETSASLARRLSRPLRVQLAPPAGSTPAELRVSGLTGSARRLSSALPIALMLVGAALAVACAILAERPAHEGIGSLGLEAGAAIWFGGALTFGAQRTTTVLRGLLLVATAVVGAGLVAAGLAFGLSGAALALAMEFGVGAVAVVVIDIVLLGVLHPRLTSIGASTDQVVVVRLRRAWPPATFELAPDVERPADPGSPPAGGR
jgi:hypothetical protein